MFELNLTYLVMKKVLHLIISLFFASNLIAQTCDDHLPIAENFEDSNVVDICWNLQDLDGDQKEWYWWEFLPAHGGYKCMVSRSVTTASGPLTPDNWLISYAIDLTSVSSQSIELSWKVRGELSGYAHEYYTIYAATNNQIADFTSSPVQRSEYVDEVGGEANWVTRTLDISSLAGNFVYIAFRHHNSTNQWSINIDDVAMSTSGTLGVEDFSNENFNHYYNSATKSLVLSSSIKPINSVEIFNVLGQNILTNNAAQEQHTLDLSNYKDGVYIARVNIDGLQKSIKFIKH